MRLKAAKTVAAALGVCILSPTHALAASTELAEVAAIVAQATEPMMRRHGIPGMAVGIVTSGRSYVYRFGVMSKATGKPVTDDTLFEIGSLSKTFTATLVSYAEVRGRLSLSDAPGIHLPALRGSRLDSVSLLDLATHTSGGMPLQFPDDVTNDDQAIRYFRDWTPTYAPGTVRTYANPSIGLLGVIAAKSLDEDFDAAMERRVFQPLGLRRTYLHVPDSETADYAQGYTKADTPIRMAPGPLAPQAYGVRTTVSDMLRFIKANMGLTSADADLQRAIIATQTGYYSLGAMTQGLIWERYRYPVDLNDLLAGNAPKVSYEPNPVARIDPPSPAQADVLINKTGSTNGFGAYVALVPGKKTGVVLLANKNYPIDARVTAAYEIVTRLIAKTPGN